MRPIATTHVTTIELVIGKPKGRPISTAFCGSPCSTGCGRARRSRIRRHSCRGRFEHGACHRRDGAPRRADASLALITSRRVQHGTSQAREILRHPGCSPRCRRSTGLSLRCRRPSALAAKRFCARRRWRRAGTSAAAAGPAGRAAGKGVSDASTDRDERVDSRWRSRQRPCCRPARNLKPIRRQRPSRPPAERPQPLP